VVGLKGQLEFRGRFADRDADEPEVNRGMCAALFETVAYGHSEARADTGQAFDSPDSFSFFLSVSRRESARRPTRRMLVEDLDDAVRFAICKDGVPIDDHIMDVLPSELRRYLAIFDA
jgi:hypothetical protein